MNIMAAAEARRCLMMAQRKSLPQFTETWPQMQDRHRKEKRALFLVALQSTGTIKDAARSLDMQWRALASYMRYNGLPKTGIMEVKE